MVDVPSRVRVPAAQVQDRGHRRDERPRGDPRPRHRPAGSCATTRGEVGFRVLVGGGLGRTPIIGHVIREFLPCAEILNYLDAILRVYNRFGRRDNKYKARIKILVKERTPAVFARDVEAEWEHLRGGPATVPDEEIERLAAHLRAAAVRDVCPATIRATAPRVADNRAFANWAERNVHPHKVPGYAIVTLSLKKTGVPPGDATVRPDGRGRRPGRPLQLRRAARLARAEPDLRRRAAERICSRCGSS